MAKVSFPPNKMHSRGGAPTVSFCFWLLTPALPEAQGVFYLEHWKTPSHP